MPHFFFKAGLALARLKFNISRRRSARRVLSTAYRVLQGENIVILASRALFIVYRPPTSVERRQGNTFRRATVSIFQYKRVELIFRAPSQPANQPTCRAKERTRPSFSRDRETRAQHTHTYTHAHTRCAHRIVFTVAKLERLPIARDYSNYRRRTRSREDQERSGRPSCTGRFCTPAEHTSDINPRESVTEAICSVRRTGRRQL